MKQSLIINSTKADQLGLGLFRYEIFPKERFVSANTALVKIFGLPSQKSLSKKNFNHFLDKKDVADLHKILESRGKVRFFETSFQSINGKVGWIAINACMSENGSREKYIEGVVQNISFFKETHGELAQEIDSLQRFLDSMPDAIYFKDAKNRITRVNKFYADGFSKSKKELIGKTDYDFFPKDQAKKMFHDDNKIIKTGKPIVGKIEKTLLPNGTWNQVITTKVPMHDRKGKIVGTMGITRDMTAHANLEHERFSMVLNALDVLGKALEMRDPYTYFHARHVGQIACEIAKALKFDETHMMQIKLAAELHDLGKISIPLDILIKPGKLSALEFQLVQEHVENCYALIKDIDFPFPLAEIVYQHHERLDGSGYPRKLKGDEILIDARILAVSDVLEAVTSHRPYRKALGINVAIKELEKGAGTRYDPKVVKTVLKIIKKNGGKPFWMQQI